MANEFHSKKYYFAYGSNLNVRQMAVRCPNAKKVGTGSLDGYVLVFRGSPGNGYLTLDKNQTEYNPSVNLGIWEIDPFDEASLDRYEGYPGFYKKETIKIPATILDENGKMVSKIVEGIIYVMNPGFSLAEPSQDYLVGCVQGFKDFGFPVKELTQAQFRSEQHEDPNALKYANRRKKA